MKTEIYKNTIIAMNREEQYNQWIRRYQEERRREEERLQDLRAWYRMNATNEALRMGGAAVSAGVGGGGNNTSSGIDFDLLYLIEGINQDYIGDSITFGQQATATETQYSYLIDQAIGGGSTYTKRAAGGVGVLYGALQANQNYNTLTTRMISFMVGFNDIHRAFDSTTSAIDIPTYAPKTEEKIRGAIPVILGNAFAKTIHLAGDFTEETGGWTGASLTGGKTTAKFVTGGTAGLLSHTIDGSNILFIFHGSDGITPYGDVTITIDTVDKGTFNLNNKSDGISDGTYTNLTCPRGILISNLGEGSHDVEIAVNNGVCPFDCAIELIDPSLDYANPVLAFGNIKSTSEGYNQNMSFTDVQHGDNIMDFCNGIIEEVVDEFQALGYPIAYVDSAEVVNSTRNLEDSSDGSHPNDIGNAAIASQAIEQIRVNTNLIFNSFKDVGYNSISNGWIGRNSSAWQAFCSGDYYLPSGVDGWAQFSVVNNTNDGFGMLGFNTTKALEIYTGYEYAMAYEGNDVKRLTSGGGYTALGVGQRAIGSKLRLELNRGSAELYIKYAADGIDFNTTLYTWTSVPDSNYYINLCFRWPQFYCYELEISNGFIK